jgi:nuclear pore complex protein Nup155
VLTTKEEAMVCALARDDHQRLEVIPTKFVIPSDWVSFLSVVSTKSGRIFLGGQDGNLYELDYDLLLQPQYHYAQPHTPANDATATQQKLEDFYDGVGANAGASCPSVLHQDASSRTSNVFVKSKRIIDSLSASYKQPPRKCRKLNHSQSPISNIMPDIINRITSAVFGDYTTTGGGPIIQMVVDHEREVLYTLSTRGWICALDIAESPKIVLAAVLNTPSTSRLYLEAVSRGRMYPPSPSNARDGLLTFPGGGEAAQAGVGGMEGARHILKQEEADRGSRRRAPASSILTPVSIQVVPNEESTRITLVAITAGGLRYYLSSLVPQTLGTGPTSPPFGTPRHRHPWKPHSRLTLCHIRAPPSLKEAKVVMPDHGPDISKDHRVDAACYRLGVFFVAFQQAAQKTPPVAGNILVVASADSVARLQEKNKKEKANTVTYVPPGGVCEVTSFPMAMGGSSDLGQTPLWGGRVWEICSDAHSRDKLWALAVKSKTPTDTELGFSIAPAYLPPSTQKKMLPPSSQSKSQPTRSLVPTSSNHRSMSSLAINIVTNLILSRPVRYGIEVQKPVASTQERQILYRISKRCGSQGFSLSAADKKSNNTTAASKSARLSPWLLRPDVIPLNPLALQHLETPNTSFMALNAGGIHSFQCPSILQRLSFAIQAAGTNVRADPMVSKFFNDYGHAEGCALCLILAMKPSSSLELKENALRAALSRAYRPTLQPKKSDDQSSEQLQHRDPWIPAGYSFASSALCNGLTLVLARLLRPIWHKPAVVVTEGRVLKRGSSSITTPAKVELLMDDEMLEEVRHPLVAMRDVIVRVFGKAISSVPLSKSASVEKDQMEIDDNENFYLTRALEYQRKGQSQNTSDTLLRPSDAEALAQHVEERNIHLLYRLLSRTTQLLSLLSHLRRAHDMPELPEVEWGLLHGIPVAQLVQTKDGQERAETLLNSLITSDTARKKMAPTASADSNEISSLLAKECYFFFSPGSRYAYLGFKFAEEALAIPVGQSRRSIRSAEAKRYFELAAKNWYSASLIAGRLMHTSRETESYRDIARRAEQCGSPLAKACSLMVELENVAAVVMLCLATAANFDGRKQASRDNMDDFYQGSTVLAWEKGLYQQRQDSTRSEISNGTPASNSLALGTTVTASDAIGTCYALVFYHVSKLLDSQATSMQYKLGERMVSVSCSFESDKGFLHAFFNHLLYQNHEDVLLRIDSPELEKWLVTQKKDQPDLLLKYYQNQGRHTQAAEAAWSRANCTDVDLILNDRIECLVHASDSYSAAIHKCQGNPDELGRKKKEVEERLEIARMQARVRQTLSSTKYELSTDEVDKLSHSLLSVNDLFNKYAMPCDMYENCLLLLHVCRHDDVGHIQKFWKSIFCEEIFPCSTRSEQVYRALCSFPEGSLLEDSVVSLLNDGVSSHESLFENGGWMKRLEGRVVNLGREVFGHGADYVFPVDFILSNLEGKARIFLLSRSLDWNLISKFPAALRRAYVDGMPESDAKETQGWPLSVMVSVGIPYLVVLAAFEQLIEQENHATMGGVAPGRRLEHLQNVVAMLEAFESSARSGLHQMQSAAFEEVSARQHYIWLVSNSCH